MMDDIRYALRSLARQPLFLITVTFTLALGIGATTAVFSGVYALLLKPLPYREPDKLITMTEALAKGQGDVVWEPLFRAVREENRILEGVTAWSSEEFTLSGDGETERLSGASVAANFFPLLGSRMETGRNFLPEEMQNGGPQVAILSNRLWHQRFNSDIHIVGRSITLDAKAYTIVGVLSPASEFPGNFVPQLFVPLRISEGSGLMAVDTIGRLRPDVSLERARSDLQVVADRHTGDYPPSLDALMTGARVQVKSL